MDALVKKLLAVLLMLLALQGQAVATDIVAAEAFIDDANVAEGSGTPVNVNALGSIFEIAGQLDISSLSLGVHIIYTRVKDEDNVWSEPMAQPFVITEQPPNYDDNYLTQAEYFFNHNDLGPGSNTPISLQSDNAVFEIILEQIQQTADITALSPGVNTISFRTRDNVGQWSEVMTQPFLRPDNFNNPTLVHEAEYFLGADPGIGNGIPVSGSFNDVIEILEQGGVHPNNFPGVYKVGFRAKDSNGLWSDTHYQYYEIPEGGLPDPAVVDISAISGNTSESGSQATFTVVLSVQPTADVSMTIASSDTSEGIVDKAGVTFTSGNWNQAQTVTVTGIDDTLLDGDVAYQVHISAASSDDLRFHGYGAKTLFPVNIDVDLDAPVVFASLESGSFEYSRLVELSCTDLESGCHRIHYTLDGTVPTTDSELYGSPINIDKDITLEAISVDKSGNVSEVLIRSYQVNTIDNTPPQVSITSPVDGGNYEELFTIEGTSSDEQSGIEKVQLQITDGSRYWGPLFETFNWVDEPYWIDVYPGNYPTLPKDWSNWGLSATAIDLYDGVTYTATAKAIDQSGNESFDSVIFSLAGEQAYTTLTVDTSAQTLLQNETLDIAGKLSRLPETTISLAGRTITLTVTRPDMSQAVLTTQTYDPLGFYFFDDVDEFNLKGTYELKLDFAATPLLAESTVTTSVLVGSSAGYAIILQGKYPSEEGLASHNKTTNRIYATLKSRGFIDENILYLNYDTNQAGVDGLPARSTLIDALTNWLPSRVNGSPAPMYLIFADHGNPDTFYLDDETFNASELDSWLNSMESSLNEFALLEPRTVIYGACYSGSFLPALSKSSTVSDAGRIIVTSSAADEVSYKGPNEPDNIRSGEYFLEALFKQLGRGDSLARAFRKATRITEIYTRRGGSNSSTINAYFDNAVQHPLLDDNGDGVGTNLLSDGAADGHVAEKLFLGAGLSYDTNSILNPAEVVEVAPLQILPPQTYGANLWLKANDDSSVSSAWAEVRSPVTELSPYSSTEQLTNNLPKILMTFKQQQGRWEAVYPDFAAEGRYEVYYFVKDNESGDISPMKQGSVYKQKPTNTAPTAVELLSPADTSTTRTVLLLDWSDSTDAESDDIFYTLEIATDDAFADVVHIQEDLTESYAVIDNRANLQDLTKYYWRVRSIDSYGAETVSGYFIFNTDNTNGIPGILKGIIYSDIDFSRIADVNMSAVNQSGGSPVIALTDANGEFVVLINDGLVNLTGTLPGYTDIVVDAIKVTSGEVTDVNLAIAGPDTDGDGVADSQDPYPDTAIGSNDTIDHDGDGMSDQFEVTYELDPMDAADADLDNDDDGFSNKEEFDAGSNPNDPESQPKRKSVILRLLPLLMNQ